jgi:hypothetical protein
LVFFVKKRLKTVKSEILWQKTHAYKPSKTAPVDAIAIQPQ